MNPIAILNDAFRKNPENAGGRLVVTRSVILKGRGFLEKALAAIKTFDNFNADNDPHKEHDFVSVEIEGEMVWWTCDYYTPDLRHGSENPANPSRTLRVATIMLAGDY